MSALTDDILIKVVSEIHDPVTTTDELIPSGETSSFRSNPLGLAEFTLSRKDPEYVGKAKAVQLGEKARVAGEDIFAALPEAKEVFDKINENFIRCSFYELVSRYLSSCYTFAIEQNNSVGRSDFEMTGIPGTDYYTDDRVVEFKYYRMKEAEKMLALSEPLPEHVEQVKRYGEDTKKKFPNYNVRTYVVYICANKGWKCWEV